MADTAGRLNSMLGPALLVVAGAFSHEGRLSFGLQELDGLQDVLLVDETIANELVQDT